MGRRSPLQRTIFGLGVLFHLCAAVILGLLMTDSFGSDLSRVIYSSILATIFFLVCVGVVLNVMGHANLPSLKLENDGQ